MLRAKRNTSKSPRVCSEQYYNVNCINIPRASLVIIEGSNYHVPTRVSDQNNFDNIRETNTKGRTE